MPFQDQIKLKSRLLVDAEVVFESGWRIGTGREGTAGSDLGLIRDIHGNPVLPGTSLKGCLRNTAETLTHALNMSACCLNAQSSGVNCVSDTSYFRKVSPEYQALRNFEKRMNWIETNTCDVCKLFGSPIASGRIRVSEGRVNRQPGRVEVRDSVVIDRDSRTAVSGLKYDYEVAPAGTSFLVQIEVRDARDQELAMIGATLIDWCDGISIGGFKTRGLGRAAFQVKSVQTVDLSDQNQRIAWLTKQGQDRYQKQEDWCAYFSKYIESALTA